MKSKLQIFSIFVLICLSFWACRSSRKSFERGDYEQTVRLSSRELCNRPKNPSEQENYLRQSYPLALQTLKTRLQGLQSSADMMRWVQIADIYRSINAMHTSIVGCSKALAIIPNPERYERELQEANNNAAEAYYNLGVSQINIGTREAGREAIRNLQTANQLVPNIKPDIIQRIEQARLLAVFKVFVDQIPTQSSFAPNDEFFRNQINRHLISLRKTNTLDFFFTRAALPVPPNQILSFQFFDFIVGENNTQERIETIIGDTVKVNVNGTSYLQAPKTELRTYTKTVRSTAIMEMKIYDQQNQRMLLHERIPAEYIWQHQWARSNGDQAALKPAQLALVNTIDRTAPDRQALFVSLCEKLLEQLRPRLTEQYRNQN
ncbi:MAG: hypothetical protein EAZ85_13005 [Bacteroidetes bacterium]|nr:MAG: hypothetical protein EAZ85_13005 [Bacteroidota bacterium]